MRKSMKGDQKKSNCEWRMVMPEKMKTLQYVVKPVRSSLCSELGTVSH